MGEHVDPALSFAVVGKISMSSNYSKQGFPIILLTVFADQDVDTASRLGKVPLGNAQPRKRTAATRAPLSVTPIE